MPDATLVASLTEEIDEAISLIEKRVEQFLDTNPSRDEIARFYLSFERKPSMALPNGGWVTRIKTAGGIIGQALGGLIGYTEGPITVPPATIEKKVGKARKTWMHDRIKPVVIEAILKKHTDPETGAITTPYTALLNEALETASISAWKVTKLRPLGINADMYCETGDATTSLIVRESGNTPAPEVDDG